MPQTSLPAKVEILYKLRSQRMQETRLAVTLNRPFEDSDSVLDGIQNTGEFAVDFDPADEKYDLFYRSVNEANVGNPVAINGTVIRVTLSGALNSTDLTFTVSDPGNDATFRVGDVLKLDDELVVASNINTSTWLVTVEERGAHGTTAASHSSGITVVLMIYTVPHNAITLAGSVDPLVPDPPTSLVLTDAPGNLGNEIVFDIGIPTTGTISMKRYQVQLSTVLWADDNEDMTGLRGELASGSDGAVTQGGTTLTTSVTLDTAWAGKTIYKHEGLTFDGIINSPTANLIDSVVDNGDGSWTVHLGGDNVFRLRTGKEGTSSVVSFIIADGWKKPGDPSTWIGHIRVDIDTLTGPGDPDVTNIARGSFFTSETVFVRVRLNNFRGFSKWMYWDGSTGTLTKGSAVTFSPGAMTDPAFDVADNSITASKLTENSMNFSSSLVFSASSNTVAAWGAGTIEFADGSSFTIDAGNTGAMSALTYIYLDPIVSTTVLQTTTVLATAVGDRKQIISVAEDGPSGEDAFFVPVVGTFGFNSSHVGVNSIATGALQANSVTAVKINVVTLDAISADVGTLTAGNITGLTITGGLIQTDTAGNDRIELSTVSTPDRITWKNAANNDIGRVGKQAGNTLEFLVTSLGLDLEIKSTVGDIRFYGGNLLVMTADVLGMNFHKRIDLGGQDIQNVGDLEVDSITKDGAGNILFNDIIDMGGRAIINAGDIELDSLTKDGAGDILFNDNLDMGTRSIINVTQIELVSIARDGVGDIIFADNLDMAGLNLVDVGDIALDSITAVTGNIAVNDIFDMNNNGIIGTGSIQPESNVTKNLGQDALRWANFFTRNVNLVEQGAPGNAGTNECWIYLTSAGLFARFESGAAVEIAAHP